MKRPGDFRDAVSNTSEYIRIVDIDLSVARDNVEFRASAGRTVSVPTVAFDSDTVVSTIKTTGVCFVRFGDRSAPAVCVQAGMSLELDEFDTIFVTNAVQAAAMLRLEIGVRSLLRRSVPPNIIATVANDVNIANDYKAHKIGASKWAIGPIASAGQSIITTGTNVNGAIVRSFTLWLNAAGDNAGLHSDTALPLGWQNCNIALAIDTIRNVISYQGPGIYLPPGFNLSARSSAATAGYSSGSYDLL